MDLARRAGLELRAATRADLQSIHGSSRDCSPGYTGLPANGNTLGEQPIPRRDRTCAEGQGRAREVALAEVWEADSLPWKSVSPAHGVDCAAE